MLIRGTDGLSGQSRRDRPLMVVFAWDESTGNPMSMGRVEYCFDTRSAND